MEKREIVCIGCPMGCLMEVELENNNVIKVTGNTCKRGETYAQKECTNPTRIVTSTVKVVGGKETMLPIKTERDIPKDKILMCISELKGIVVKAPIHTGDIVVSNIAGTGVNVIATKEISSK